MRHFKSLILALTLAVASFAAIGKIQPLEIAPSASDPFLAYDRPFHFGKSDTGLTIAQSDTLLLYANSNRGPLKSSDFNSKMFLYNAAGGKYGGFDVQTRKDSLVCLVSYLNEDNDSASVTFTYHQLDHGTTYRTAGTTSTTVLSYDVTGQLRLAWPLGYSNQYFVKAINTTATDTLRFFRTSCGDK